MKPTILIADTNNQTRKQLKNLFRRERYIVETACMASEVIKQVQNNNIDIVIMDVDLLEMKGYEIVQILKKIHGNLPIIMMSQDSSLEVAKRVRETGVFFYALKPLDVDEIITAVSDAFKKIRPQRNREVLIDNRR